jgi:acetyl esterase/lipase
MIEIAARLVSRRRIYRMDAAQLQAFLAKERPRRNPGLPAWVERKYMVCTEKVMGRPLYIIAPRPDDPYRRLDPGGAVLFLHGGGFINEAHPVHWRAVARIVDTLGLTVWMPAYPLVSGRSTGDRINYPALRDINEMIRSVYGYMLVNHKDQPIVFLGDSAGAALALIFCHHNKTLALPDPMPAGLILLSPGVLIERDPAIRAAMRVLEKQDVMLATAFMDSLVEMMGIDAKQETYFTTPLYGDFSGFPQMEVFSGTREIFYPQVVDFVERMRSAGTPVAFHAGVDMMHIWPYMPVAPESNAALEEIIGIIGRAMVPRGEREAGAEDGTGTAGAAGGTGVPDLPAAVSDPGATPGA